MNNVAKCPLIAILRGVEPEEVEGIGDALVDAGIRIIEVPLNSPDPLRSIGRLTTRLGKYAMIGAGTVLNSADISHVASAGGTIIVSPDSNVEVIAATARAGLVSAPGYFTLTEAFSALRAGAHALKLFPAEGASPAVLKAQRAVLPSNATIIMVGGITPDNMKEYLAAGANGFGLGTGLYSPGRGAEDVATRARSYVETFVGI
jgi:2-dehydro-3-deoxyphosphogalactonate aldolase